MSITLKIVSYQRLTPGQQESYHSDLNKFSIGRSPGNDWPLPDPQRFMSGTHCWVENRDGTWVLTDNSTNGVFINGSDQRVTRGDSVDLNEGDHIRLGDYELQVNLESGSSADLSASIAPPTDIDPFLDDFDEEFAPPKPPPPSAKPDLKDVNTPLSQMDSGLLGDSVSIDSLYEFGEEEEPPPPPETLADRGNQGSPMDQHFSAPKVSQPPASDPIAQPPAGDPIEKYATDFDDIPDNWDEETGLVQTPSIKPPAPPTPEPQSPEPPPTVQEPAPPVATPPPVERRAKAPPPPQEYAPRPAAQATGGGSNLAAFARGADLDLDQLQVNDQDAFFNDLGELLKTLTMGLMQALTSRNQVRSEFRLEQTMIGPTENNPFKFSISAEEAMMRLLSRTDGAYQRGVEAAAEAVDDINAHQLAVMAGTEAALKSILRRFDPEKLEAKFGHESCFGHAVPMLKKAKCWDFYEVRYAELSEAVDDDFQQLFGAEFSNAYEEQLDRLKSSRKEPLR